MKQEEKQMRQYLRQIGRQLEVTGTLRERILSDLENDIRAGLEQGETMDKIRARMGTPEEIGRIFRERREHGICRRCNDQYAKNRIFVRKRGRIL